MNEIIHDKKVYKLESVWKTSKNDNSKDTKGKNFSFPVEGKVWNNKNEFIEKLYCVQDYIINYVKKNIISTDKLDCLLCKEKDIISKRFILDKYIWDDGFIHYIEKHNIKPSDVFLDKIFKYGIPIEIDLPIKLSSRIKQKENIVYLKLDKNQIMILDALMKHGGYNKKYYDTKKKEILRYSEHAGYIDIVEKNVENIIVSGNTLRIDRGDEEIFLPNSTNQTYNYEYIFHTHPPTPKPGGRAIDGILYEFPSSGDIFHFIDHYNDGKVIGSLVMTAEGLYNIRNLNNDKIDIDEDKLYEEIKKIFRQVQEKAIDKYGADFSTYEFYSKISQDTSFIEKINLTLKKYHLTIDFFPRVKDFRGSWIVDTIYIPLFNKK